MLLRTFYLFVLQLIIPQLTVFFLPTDINLKSSDNILQKYFTRFLENIQVETEKLR